MDQGNTEDVAGQVSQDEAPDEMGSQTSVQDALEIALEAFLEEEADAILAEDDNAPCLLPACGGQ